MNSRYTREIHTRLQVLRSLDLQAARQLAGLNSPDDVVLMGLHKARYECTSLEPEFRHASRAWLAGQGAWRMDGTPLLPEGVLPQ